VDGFGVGGGPEDRELSREVVDREIGIFNDDGVSPLKIQDPNRQV